MLRTRGFTLIEILIAIGIFAMVGLVSGQMLGRIIDASERTDARTERLYQIQRAIQLMERDLLQLSNRAIRDEFGDPQPALVAGMAAGVEFTRLGWRNPLGRPRSEIQRIRYELVDGELRRVFWLVLDRAEETLPRVQPLLNDVERMEITYLDQELNDYPLWPPGASDLEDGSQPELSAMELRLEVAPLGEITRLFEVQLVDVSTFSLPGLSPDDDTESQEDDTVEPPEGEGQ